MVRSLPRSCSYLKWALCLMVALCACDTFSVRESEPPIEDGEEDILNFSTLLDGTGETFARLDYSDLFLSDFSYQQGTSRPRTRSEVISRLHSIERQYPTIDIEWELDASAVPLFSRQGTVELDSMTYRVYINGERTSPPDYTGHIDLGLVFVDYYWAITYWYDFPDSTDDAGHSFFNPDFVD